MTKWHSSVVPRSSFLYRFQKKIYGVASFQNIHHHLLLNFLGLFVDQFVINVDFNTELKADFDAV